MKKNTKAKTTMTANEVAVLIEDLRSQFKIFGEDLSEVKTKLNTMVEVIKSDFGKRLTHLETTLK